MDFNNKNNSCCKFPLNSFKTKGKPLCVNPESRWVKFAMETVPRWVYHFVKYNTVIAKEKQTI